MEIITYCRNCVKRLSYQARDDTGLLGPLSAPPLIYVLRKQMSTPQWRPPKIHMQKNLADKKVGTCGFGTPGCLQSDMCDGVCTVGAVVECFVGLPKSVTLLGG